MQNTAKFQVIYNGETLEFEHGAQAYIFDYALYWDIDKLGLNVLKAFVYFVYRCYMKDDNANVDNIIPRTRHNVNRIGIIFFILRNNIHTNKIKRLPPIPR